MGRGSTEAAGVVETVSDDRQKSRQRRKEIEESLHRWHYRVGLLNGEEKL